METIPCCTAFANDFSCVIGNYLDTCMKELETMLLSDPRGKMTVSFQYLKYNLSH